VEEIEDEEFLEATGLDTLQVITRSDVKYDTPRLNFKGFLGTENYFAGFTRFGPEDGYNRQMTQYARGSSIFYYGELYPGGQRNRVAKNAVPGRSFGSAALNFGQIDALRTSIDYNLGINESHAIRVNAVHDEKKFRVDYDEEEFDGITLSTTHDLTDRTRLEIHLEHFKELGSPNNQHNVPDDDRIRQETTTIDDFLIPASPDIIPRDKAGGFSGPDTFRKEEGEFVFATLKHKFNDRLRADLSLMHEDLDDTQQRRGGTDTLRYDLADFGLLEGRGSATLLGWSYLTNPAPSLTPEYGFSTSWSKSEFWSRNKAARGSLFYDIFTDWTKQTLRLTTQQTNYDYSNRVLNRYGINPRRSNLLENVDPSKSLEDIRLINNPNDQRVYWFSPTSEKIFLLDGNSADNPLMRFGSNSALTDLDSQFYETAYERSSNKITSFEASLNGQFLNGRLRTLFGLRYDRSKMKTERRIYEDTNNRGLQQRQNGIWPGYDDNLNGVPLELERTFSNQSTDHRWSPSVGGLYWLNEKLAVFGSYSESFLEPDRLAVDPNGNILPQQSQDTIEAGFRWVAFDNKLIGQVSAFREKRDDVKVFLKNADIDRLFPNVEDAIGTNITGEKTREKGVELELYYKPSRKLSMFLGYAYRDNEKTESRVENDGFFEGETVEGTAKHTAQLTARYTIKRGKLKNLYFGGTLNYRSKPLYNTFYGLTDGSPDKSKRQEYYLEDKLQLDTFVGWRKDFWHRGHKFTYSTNFAVFNIFDADGLITFGGSNASYLEPRRFVWRHTIFF
jgi:hypothetical protein